VCYHYSVPDLEALEHRFHARFDTATAFPRVYHVSGFTHPPLPVITNEVMNRIQLFTWGLIPHWVPDTATATKLGSRTLNARAETIHEKPSFRGLITSHRCLVLADGFFEWHHHRGRTFLYYIRLTTNEPFSFAGLWDRWTVPATRQVQTTYSIITTRANWLLEQVHNTRKRMPVILRPDDEARWLSSALTRAEIDDLLVSYDASRMQAHPVSRRITAPGAPRNHPETIEPVTYPELPPITRTRVM
jgi:putative SOS response-associated peptidase YedK